eukprot:g2696.t1
MYASKYVQQRSRSRKRQREESRDIGSNASQEERLLEVDHEDRVRSGWEMYETKIMKDRADSIREVSNIVRKKPSPQSLKDMALDSRRRYYKSSPPLSRLQRSWMSIDPASSTAAVDRSSLREQVMSRDDARKSESSRAYSEANLFDADSTTQKEESEDGEDEEENDSDDDVTNISLIDRVRSAFDWVFESVSWIQSKTPIKKIRADARVSRDDDPVALSSDSDDELKSEATTSSLRVAQGHVEMDDSFFDLIPSDLFTRDERLRMSMALNKNADPGEELGSVGKDFVTREKAQCLRHGEWLNDEVINFVIRDVCERTPGTFAFNSFFFSKLTEDDNTKNAYARVERWTRGLDLWQFEKIIIPLHLSNHWAIAVVYTRERKIAYFDSLNPSGRGGRTVFRALRSYLKDDHMKKRREALDMRDWVDISVVGIPQQQNYIDCGVFAAKFADLVCANKPLTTFDQRDIPVIRADFLLRIILSGER